MAGASRRKTVWVWGIVLAIFAVAIWVAFTTIRSSFQPLSVIDDPFPDEDTRPEVSEDDRGAVNFLVFGQAEQSNQTLSIFHLADGRRRIDVINVPTDMPTITDVDDIAETLVEVEEFTGARMEHVMLWDLEFLAELDDTTVTAEDVLEHPETLSADDVWATVLQEALDTRDPGQLQAVANTLTPYIAADRGLNTGRITDLARSLRHVPADNISSCTIPADISEAQLAGLVEYFATGEPTRCAELFGQRE